MKKITLLTFVFLSICMTAFAQNATIKGIVQDANTKEGLFGVNVIVKGSSNGVSTGIDGDFELKVNSGTVVLVVSYLGYNSKEERVVVASGETKNITIDLSEEATLLETIVVSASKFEKKLGEETVSLDVIKPTFLDNQNLITVDDAVERNPGVAVIDGQVNIRGGAGYSYGAGSRVLLLLDDLPILQADAGYPNWTSIPTENIGQIEIIKGAASALYGSSAMNGIINVRTQYATNEPVTKISVWGSQYATPSDEDGYRRDWWNLTPDELAAINPFLDPKRLTRPYEAGINFGHRQKFGKFDLVMGAQAVASQDHKFNGFNNRGRLSVQTRYRVNENINFGINGNVQGGKSGTFFLWNGNDGVNKYLPAVLTGEPTVTEAFRVTIDPFFNYQDDKGNRHKVLGRWYKVDNDNGNNQGNFSNFYYGEYQYQKHWSDINLTLTTGGVASYVAVEAPLYGTVGDNKLKGRNLAAFLQLDKKFFNKLNVSLGARLENYEISETKSETKPVFRAGVNYQAAEYTYIRASFGQGFRFPTIAEKFINTSLGSDVKIVPNNTLVSETGMSAELGLKQGIRIGKFNAFVDVAGFFTRYYNMMEFNPTDDQDVLQGASFGFQSQNVGNTQILGLEVSLQGEGKIAKKFPTTAMLGYTYLAPTYLDWDEIQDESSAKYNVLKYRFRHMFTGSWDVNFTVGRGSIDFGVSGRYFSFMENIDQAFVSFIPGLLSYRDSRKKDPNNFDESKKGQYKGDFILDLRAGYTFHANKNKYKISGIVNNVMNKEYSLRPGLVESPMQYTLRLDFEF